MRVRWVLEDAERPGGVESVTRDLVKGLRAEGCDAEAVSWFAREPVPRRSTPFGWLAGKVQRARAHSAAATHTAKALRRELEASPDLVVVLDPGSLPVAVRLRGVPRWGIHLHWSPDLLLRPWRHLSGEGIPAPLRWVVALRMRQVGRRNRRVLADAPFLVTLTASHTRMMKTLRSDVIELPNPARLTVRDPSPAPNVPAHVAYLGRVSHEKGPDLFVRAASASRGTTDVRWSVAGAGPEEETIRKLSDRLDAGVSFIGWIREPRDFLESVDVFVLPSRTEAVPLVLAEALAAGCHVVATDAGEGVRDVLAGGRLGRIVPVGDVTGLAAAVAQALDERRAGVAPDPTAVAELARRHEPTRVLGGWRRLLVSLVGG